MNDSQKQIIEDKVIKMINFWNKIEDFKEDENLFMTPRKKDVKEETKIRPKPPIVNQPTDFNWALTKSSKIKNIKSISKNRKKKMLASDIKFFKNPLVMPESK